MLYVFVSRYDVVTPGEAQRVSFARIFYHMPPFVCESVDATTICIIIVAVIL